MTDYTVPYIPETITVHLGRPDEAAENVTVPFRDSIPASEDRFFTDS